MQPISKTKLKELASFRQQKICEEQGVFVAEGAKLAAEVLSMGVPIDTLCATEEWYLEYGENNPTVRNQWKVDVNQLERISTLRQPNKVWMLMERSVAKAQALKSACQPSSLTLVLERIQDPGNLGTIIRTADWFGIRNIVCSYDSVSCFNSKVVQSTMGSLFRVDVSYCDLSKWLSNFGLPVYGAVIDGIDLRQAEIAVPAALVIGNESRGISPEIRARVTNQIAIPNLGGSCESLNAAVATAILVSQFTL